MVITFCCGDKPWQRLEDLLLFVFMAVCCFGHILMGMECVYFPVLFFMHDGKMLVNGMMATLFLVFVNDAKMLILKQLFTTAIQGQIRVHPWRRCM